MACAKANSCLIEKSLLGETFILIRVYFALDDLCLNQTSSTNLTTSATVPMFTYRFTYQNPVYHRHPVSYMGFHRPPFILSREAWDSDTQEDNGFGYPLQRMVFMVNGVEKRGGLFSWGPDFQSYRKPASQSSSTSSHMFFV